MIEVAVVGAGPMGRLHARAVAAHPEARLVEVVDRDPAQAAAVAGPYGAQGSERLRTDPELVIVAVPARAHVRVALPLLAQRWVLVEKPLARTVSEARALVHPRCLAAHSERFHPALRARRRPPRRVEILRESPWSGRGTDVDVILDLMIHDLDLVRGWSGGELELDDAGGRRGRSERLDHAWVSLVWAGGSARLEASRDAWRRWRRARLDGEVVDLLAPVEGEDALGAQLSAVLRHLRTGQGAVTAADALGTLALAEQVRTRCLGRAMDSMDTGPRGWG